MEYKKHHYVPRFYLKQFSSKPNRINIYNIKQKLFIEDAGLKNQCYKNRFYGADDELENLLGDVEAENSKILNNMICNEHLPIIKTEDYLNFLAFIATQLLRTSKSAEKINTNIDGLMKKVMEDDPQFRDIHLEKYKIGIKNSIFFSLSFIPLIAYGLSDLAFHLVFCGYHRFFITSDSPIAKYNQFLEPIIGIGKTGIESKGLLIFFPLSPHYLLILYDKDVYHSADGKPISHFINDNDVRQLNMLQSIEADENIFFTDWQQKDELTKLAKSSLKYRRTNKVLVEKLEEVGHEKTSHLIHEHQNTPNINLDLSFLKIKRSVKKISLSTRTNLLYRRALPKELLEGMELPSPSRPMLFRRPKKVN